MTSEARIHDVGIFRNSAPFFAALLLLAIPAFWPTYLNVKQVEADYHVHLHGVSLFLWAVLVIVQPWLIHSGSESSTARSGRSPSVWRRSSWYRRSC